MRLAPRIITAVLFLAPMAFAQDIFFEAEVDPITDANTSFAGFATVDWDQWDDDHGAITVRCEGNDYFDIAIVTNAFLGSNERFEVTYRFGDLQPVIEMWWGSTSNKAAFVPDEVKRSFLSQLFEHSSFVWRVTAYDDDVHTLIFDVPPDFRAYIERLGCVEVD